LVAVKVYVVVTVGLAVGLAFVPDESVLLGDQEYVIPETAVIPTGSPFMF
jgi:hypothetical protein